MDIAKYPRTPHLEDSGLQRGESAPDALADADLAREEDLDWVVEEKLDGANAALSFDGAGTLHLQSRGHFLDVDGRPPRERHFSTFKAWARMHEGAFLERLEDRYTVYGEWMESVHTQFYDRLPSLFLEFDVLDRRTGAFLSTPARDRLLAGLPLPAVPVLGRGPLPDRDARAALVGPSLYRSDGWRESLEVQVRRSEARHERVLEQVESTDLSEGIYLKGERGDAVALRAKHVRPGFVQRLIESDSHWHDRPTVRNACAPGVEFLDPEGVAPRADRFAGAAPGASPAAPPDARAPSGPPS